jgi:hypothetical protein
VGQVRRSVNNISGSAIFITHLARQKAELRHITECYRKIEINYGGEMGRTDYDPF